MAEKLKINACSVSDGNISVESGESFDLMLNPSDFTHDRSIDYNEEKTPGQLGSDLKFNGVKPETLKFETVIDGTGAIPPAPGKETEDVKTQLDSLQGIVYKYDGSKHEPAVVRILWGSVIFYGRLSSLDVKHTLFSPDGVPLRSKLTLTFSSYLSNEEEALKANRSSPDLTHIIIVKEGDTLPLLCHRIYNSSIYVTDVARANDLTNFRQIKAGTRLVFPPLR